MILSQQLLQQQTAKHMLWGQYTFTSHRTGSNMADVLSDI